MVAEASSNHVARSVESGNRPVRTANLQIRRAEHAAHRMNERLLRPDRVKRRGLDRIQVATRLGEVGIEPLGDHFVVPVDRGLQHLWIDLHLGSELLDRVRLYVRALRHRLLVQPALHDAEHAYRLHVRSLLSIVRIDDLPKMSALLCGARLIVCDTADYHERISLVGEPLADGVHAHVRQQPSLRYAGPPHRSDGIVLHDTACPDAHLMAVSRIQTTLRLLV